MNYKIKQRWIDALNSGDYIQGKGRLRQHVFGKTQFCCLGVLCNLYAQEHPEIAEHLTDSESYMGQKCYPPRVVLEWAGLRSADELWKRNDGVSGRRKHSFNEIAKYIGENL